MIRCFVATLIVYLLFSSHEVAAASCGWAVTPSDNANKKANILQSVAVVSTNNAWAVGYYYDRFGVSQTLVENWNGVKWAVVPSPNSGGQDRNNDLFSVAVVSPTDVWAVGRHYPPIGGSLHTLIEHWNGVEWAIVPSPNRQIEVNSNQLTSVTVISANDIWAVGSDYARTGGSPQTLTEHWDGERWTIIPSPNAHGSGYLTGVSAVSSSDVWAIGLSSPSTNTNLTLTEHWNGARWTVVSSPNINDESSLYAIAAVSQDDIWAIGDYSNGSVYSTFTEHWNGSGWTIVPIPNPSSIANFLFGVSAASSHDVWAVGFYTNAGTTDTLIDHWNGVEWANVTSPDPSSVANPLYGVAVGPASGVFAVGYYNVTMENQTLTLLFHC